MQGHHNFQPELFVQIDYQALIPKHHLLRRIDKVLDLSFVKQLTKEFYSDSQGRPSIDPEVFFRICILGHIYGIKSDRQLCEELEVNIAYRWFVRLSMSDTVPDHSSLTRVRDRLGVGCFAVVFEQIVEQCRAAGLVPGKRIITDASLVEANASVRKLERREQPVVAIEVGDEKHPSQAAVSPTVVMKREQASTHTPASKVDGDVSSVAASAPSQQLARREQPAVAIEVADEKQQSQAATSPTAVAKRERISNRTHVSPVDRDATLVNRAGYPMGLYQKVHYCIDVSSRVITDCHVTTGADHENTVIRQRIEYQQERFGFPIEEVIADAGYSSGKNCQWQSSCYLGGARTCIARNKYKGAIERVQCRQEDQVFQQRMAERSWKVEGLFGEAKEQHGLRRAKYRGSEKMRIQTYLIGIAQNLERLAVSLDFYFRWIRFWFIQRFLLLQYSFQE